MKNKGLSPMIAYVLLIAIAIALSPLVYSFLRHLVDEREIPQCDEDVSLIISDFFCNDGKLNITLSNRGLHSIAGFVLRVNDRESAEVGIYTLDSEGVNLMPGDKVNLEYDVSNLADSEGNAVSLREITLVDVQPFEFNNEKLMCREVAIQKIECS